MCERLQGSTIIIEIMEGSHCDRLAYPVQGQKSHHPSRQLVAALAASCAICDSHCTHPHMPPLYGAGLPQEKDYSHISCTHGAMVSLRPHHSSAKSDCRQSARRQLGTQVVSHLIRSWKQVPPPLLSVILNENATISDHHFWGHALGDSHIIVE